MNMDWELESEGPSRGEGGDETCSSESAVEEGESEAEEDDEMGSEGSIDGEGKSEVADNDKTDKNQDNQSKPGGVTDIRESFKSSRRRYLPTYISQTIPRIGYRISRNHSSSFSEQNFRRIRDLGYSFETSVLQHSRELSERRDSAP
ncbi:hypothetical protein Hypma_014169 [Hypsizygus marmoreus]|uniref:Uncharacterized protein n=1 Tax=Hypsizygus marmoreus TaxID=39966 RepID=A0A369K510_HYPMA|nr:hypothetical protein Hypma_014169 [Hypsizygus marmoreus]